jgi:hypothetical protein
MLSIEAKLYVVFWQLRVPLSKIVMYQFPALRKEIYSKFFFIEQVAGTHPPPAMYAIHVAMYHAPCVFGAESCPQLLMDVFGCVPSAVGCQAIS